jgi:putative heme-binding domain-containing protein
MLRSLRRPPLALLILPLVAPAFAAPAVREAWTTSRVVGTPEPPAPYVAEPAFPGLRFDTPVDLVAGPGGRRLYVSERWGRVRSFDPRNPAAPPVLFAELGPLFLEFPYLELYGIAFHPRFAATREVYLRLRLTNATDGGSLVLRGKVAPGEPLRLDPATVEPVLTFRSGSHCGGNILFGPDGMLYVTTGDAGPATPPDIHNTGQTLDDLEAAILRIDVDGRDPGRAYRIPGDNPFVALPGARGEIWAYGLRNPWKIAFRPGTDELWCGDIGWEMWEMIHRIERGGNYGWSITEGPQPVKTTATRGPTPILPPVVAHPHTEAASITGGYFYTGSRLPELTGAYIYADYVTGRMWALRHDGRAVTERREIARTPHKIVTFGVGGDGELYFTDFGNDQEILRLAPNRSVAGNGEPVAAFPRRLSATGLFADTARQIPQPGVAPYTLNAPLWQDGAVAERWLAMPGTAPAGLSDERRGPVRRLRATVRGGSVFARTVSLDLETGRPETRRRLETQLLHFDGREWHTHTYRWNDAQTDADLVPPEGDNATFTVRDAAAPGGERTVAWRFHSQSECQRCHTQEAGRVLGFIPGNLDASQLHAAGLVVEDYIAAAARVPLAALDDPHATAERRARSWLHVNCAHCHRFQGGGSGAFRVNIEAPSDNTLLETAPLQGDFGLHDARVVAPGAPERSTLFYRIAQSGPGRMPQLGATFTDPRALRVLWDWIAESGPAPGGTGRGGTGAPPVGSGSSETLSVATPGDALRALDAIGRERVPVAERERLIAAGLASPVPAVRALFDRFLPDRERAATLGSAIDPHALLALRGDPARGRAVLDKAACLSCHRLGHEGRAFGPDLAGVGLRLTAEQLVESLVAPSKTIAPAYTAHSFDLHDGTTQLGFVTARSPASVTLRTPTGDLVTLDPATVRQETALPISLMPEGLLAALTAQEAADLLALLAAQR